MVSKGPASRSSRLTSFVSPTKNGRFITQKWYTIVFLVPKLVILETKNGHMWVYVTKNGRFITQKWYTIVFLVPKLVILETKNGHMWVYVTKNGRFITQKWYTNGAKYHKIQSKTDSFCTKFYTIFGANLTKFISNFSSLSSRFAVISTSFSLGFNHKIT